MVERVKLTKKVPAADDTEEEAPPPRKAKPPAKAPSREQLEIVEVGKARAQLTFKEMGSLVDGKVAVRRYYFGPVQIAYAEIYEKGKGPGGKRWSLSWCVGRGAGRAYSTAEEMHEGLLAELDRPMTDADAW